MLDLAFSCHTLCRGRNVFHAGMARPGYQLGTAAAGEVAQKAMDSGKGNYLANLVLYPGMQETLLVHVEHVVVFCRQESAAVMLIADGRTLGA